MMRILPGQAAPPFALALALALSCGSDEGTKPEPQNTAPSARFTATPDSGSVSTTFLFDASASTDAEDSASALRVRWDWENDGVWDTFWSALKTASRSYSMPGAKTAKLQVKDTGGLMDDTTRTVTVSAAENSAPTASFTMDPASGTTTTVFLFDASGSSDAEDSSAALQVRWDWEDDGAWDVEWSLARTAEHQFVSPGAKTIRLQVKDTGGLTGDATRALTVSGDNAAPLAAFAVEPSLGTTATVFAVDASGSSDAQDPPEVLEVRWDWTSDGVWDTEWSSLKTASHQYASPGTKRIRMEARDSEGLADDAARSVTVTWPGPPPEDMTLVPGGTFAMGDGVAYCGTSQHDVLLTRGFYLGVHEVTNREYGDALQWAYDQGYTTATSSSVHDGLDGSTVLLLDLGDPNCQVSFDGGAFTADTGKEDYPIAAVSWYGAAAYCDWLSMRSGLPRAYDHATWQCNGGDPYAAAGFRLPTDAEWEFAAQYDDERIYPWGSDPPGCGLANFWNGALCVGAVSPVGSYPAAPAALGLYDMAGNVWEWCNDWHECDAGPSSRIDPVGPASGSARIIHGGSWGGNSDLLRASYRGVSLDPASTQYYNGFRCARTR